ncbi:MAG: sensor histidine kinase [Dehalococcoidales bacterium]|nr:sensor histidine kinase [Dehalococcoidales bacterium]
MKESSQANIIELTFKNHHFWIILAITVLLIFFYSIWPWREWEFTHGFWKWFPWLSSFYYLAVFESFNNIIGSLFMIPTIYATIIFRWKGALVLFLLALIGIAPILPYYRNDNGAMLSNISILLLPALVMLVVNFEFELRRKDKMQYLEREKERREYLSKILDAQEKERHRLAQELHDQSVQTLLAVASYAESIELSDENIDEIKKKAAFIKEKTRSTVNDLRQISVDLRPSVLDDMGLISALKWLTSHIIRNSHIRIHTSIKGLKPELSQYIEVNVFRIVQEALYNIERHAKASDVFITLDACTKSLTILIRDNGCGFIVPGKMANLVTEGKLGIIGMRERVRCLGGTFVIQSKPREGTMITIDIPLSANTDQNENELLI